MTPESHQNRTAGGGQHPQRTIYSAPSRSLHRLFQHAHGNGLKLRKGDIWHILADTLKSAPIVSAVPPGPGSETCYERFVARRKIQDAVAFNPDATDVQTNGRQHSLNRPLLVALGWRQDAQPPESEKRAIERVLASSRLDV